LSTDGRTISSSLLLHRDPASDHTEGMSISPPDHRSVPPGRFGAGLTEVEVRRFQTILRDEFGPDLKVPEAWGRAIELMSLVEMLLATSGPRGPIAQSSTEVRASSLLTDSHS